MRELIRTIGNVFGRPAHADRDTAPAAPKSLIYALCDEYRQVDLWSAYYAFRLDPRAHTWERLRRRSVAWRREETVETLLHRVCPFTGKRTPDPANVELALVTTSSFALTPSRKTQSAAASR